MDGARGPLLARPRLARRLAPTLPFGIRRLVEVAIVGSCLGITALPSPALGPARIAAVVIDEPVVRAPEVPVPVTPAPPTPAPVVPAPPETTTTSSCAPATASG